MKINYTKQEQYIGMSMLKTAAVSNYEANVDKLFCR